MSVSTNDMERGCSATPSRLRATLNQGFEPMPRFAFSNGFERFALACALCLAVRPIVTVVAGAGIL